MNLFKAIAKELKHTERKCSFSNFKVYLVFQYSIQLSL